MNFILREYNSNKISIRTDNYVSATEMCRAVGKRWSDYNRLDSTKAYYKALSSAVQIPTALLIHTVEGGLSTEQGTWIHPKAAIHLAQWLSPEFAVQVAEWVFELLMKGVVDVRGKQLNGKAFSSEDELSEAIHSLVVGLCGNRHLEREVPFIDFTNVKQTNRRLDFVTRYSKVVRGYELKLKKFTTEDLVNTLGDKSYYHLLSSAIDALDRSKNRRYRRQIKFTLMSYEGIEDEARKLLDLMPQVDFISVQDFCTSYFKKALLGKYLNQKWYLIKKVKEKYLQLLTPTAFNWVNNKV